MKFLDRRHRWYVSRRDVKRNRIHYRCRACGARQTTILDVPRFIREEVYPPAKVEAMLSRQVSIWSRCAKYVVAHA
ncbi:MAG: hypothetical protein WC789_10605 [Lentisphaeria bacterium]